MQQEIRIDPEFKALLPALSQGELEELERSILRDGCLDPFKVWEGILIDGHNRHSICERNHVGYKTTALSFLDRDEAKDWIDRNQLARRNLSPDQYTLVLGRRYERSKKQHGGDRKSEQEKSTRQSVGLIETTAQKLAIEHGVTSRTVERAGQYAQAVEAVKQIAPDIEQQIANNQAPARKEVVAAAKLVATEPEAARAILTGERTMAQVKNAAKRTEAIANLENIKSKEAKAISGVYDVVVIDPPWPMQKIERDCRPNQTEMDYPTMTESEIAQVEIPTADNAHVFLWTTHKFLPMAFRLLDKWQLKYVCVFVWHKTGGFQPVGLPQYNCEFAIYARKGTPIFVDTKAFNLCFNAGRGAHSEKPEEFYTLLRRVTAGRRLDMFGRRKIDGFDSWG